MLVASSPKNILYFKYQSPLLSRFGTLFCYTLVWVSHFRAFDGGLASGGGFRLENGGSFSLFWKLGVSHGGRTVGEAFGDDDGMSPVTTCRVTHLLISAW